MTDSIDLKFLAFIWTAVTVLVSIGSAYGTMRLTLLYHAKELNEMKAQVEKNEVKTSARMENHEHFIRGVLFRPNGATQYPTREECEACQARCQASIKDSLFSMRQSIEESEKERKAGKETWSDQFRKIAEQIGRLSGQIEQFNR